MSGRKTAVGITALTLFMAGAPGRVVTQTSPTRRADGAAESAGASGVPARAAHSSWAALQDSVAQTYARLCVTCHGSQGKGDGPAAAAFNPKPSDFTSAEFQAARSDEQIAKAITDGSVGMPRFGGQLTGAQIEELVTYVRHFGGGTSR